MSAHNFNDMQVAKVVGEHLKNKRYIFQWTFALWWLWESCPRVFVCAKSNFNLVLLIDVAFYFKCLWKYPTTVLCGPVSNETHSRTPPLAIRSLAKTQCSPWSAVSEGASTWWAWGRTSGFSSSPGTITSVNVGARRFPVQLTALQASCVGAVSLILLRSISSGPQELPWRASGGLAHQRRGCWVQEQVFRGQPGVLHLISSRVQINVLWCIILIEPAYTDMSLSSSTYQV